MNIKTPSILVPALFFAASACATPEDDVEQPDNPPVGGSADDVGDIPDLPNGPEDPAQPLPSGYCLTKENPPYEGIRHQCGGYLDASISGDALGYDVDQLVVLDFGPGVPSDSYESPMAAACCGEYDYEKMASEQSAHWDNCLYDATQQMCASVPYHLWAMAEDAKSANKLILADQLTKLGNDLKTAESQNECLAALYGEGPEGLDVIQGTQWNIAYNVWVTIDFLEIVDISLPEDPADWITCTSIFENDDSIIPDTSPGLPWASYAFSPGRESLRVTGPNVDLDILPDDTSTLVLAQAVDDRVTLGELRLEASAVTVSGWTLDHVRLGLLREAEMMPRGDGGFELPPQTPVFIGAGVMAGDTLTTQVALTSDLVLRPTEKGWRVDPFTLGYTDGNGDVWTLVSDSLDFEAD